MNSEIGIFDLSHLYINTSNIEGAGRGVFTKIDIAKDAVVEKASIVEIPINITDNTILHDYVFQHPFNKKKNLVVWGFGSMYNHSDEPNIHYYYDKDEKVMVYEALLDIEAGEELYIDYGIKWWKTRN